MESARKAIRRRFGYTVIAASIAAGLVNCGGGPTFPSTTYDGSWAGSTAQGLPISFLVSGGQVANFSVQYTLPNGGGLCGGNGTALWGATSSQPALAIIGNTFEFQGQPVTSLTGTFDSASTALGSLTVTQSGLPCAITTDSVSTTWTASKG